MPDLSTRKEIIRGQVFQPGHILPDMPMEEYADNEFHLMEERMEREKYVDDGHLLNVGLIQLCGLWQDGAETNSAHRAVGGGGSRR